MKRPVASVHGDTQVRKLYEAFVEDLAVLYPEILCPDGENNMTWGTYGTSLVKFRHADVHLAADQVRAEANAEQGKKLIAEFRGGKS